MKSLIEYIKESYIVENNIDNNKVIDFVKSKAKDYKVGASLNKGQLWLDALKAGGISSKREKTERCTDVKDILKQNGYKEIFSTDGQTKIENEDYTKYEIGDIAHTVSRSDTFGELSIFDGNEWVFGNYSKKTPYSIYDPWILKIYRKS